MNKYRKKRQGGDAARMQSSVHRHAGAPSFLVDMTTTTHDNDNHNNNHNPTTSLKLESSVIDVEADDEPIHISQGAIPDSVLYDTYRDHHHPGPATTTNGDDDDSRGNHHHGDETRKRPPGESFHHHPADDSTLLPSLCGMVALALAAVLLGAVGTALGIFNAVVTESTTTTSSVGSSSAKEDDSTAPPPPTSTLERITERGYIVCGSGPAVLPGILLPTGGSSEEEEEAQYAGLELDLCRILAAAIFNGQQLTTDDDDDDKGSTTRPSRYRMVPLSYAARWQTLQNRDVDVLFRATYNMERDVYEPSAQQGFEFSFPYYIDGIAFGGVPEHVDCAVALDFNSTTDDGVVCQDTKVCVIEGTTHEEVMARLLPEEVIVRVREDLDGFPNQCNVMASESASINSEAVKLLGYTGPYKISEQRFSREPISAVTRQGDPRWSDFVEWIIQGLIFAEEEDITQSQSFRFDSTTIFGGNDTHPHPTLEKMFEHANEVRGNYGEVYNVNVESFLQRSGMNLLNKGDSPIIYSFPLGDTSIEGPQIEVASPTVKAIKARGYLSCGVSLRKGFAEFDDITHKWNGFDVELCRAIAAALFDGVDHVRYTDMPAVQRFQELEDGLVDVLARLTTHTLARDVKEPTIGQGLSFSSPYFHDGLKFGGVGSKTQCANNRDVISPDCQDLRICVLEGTTILSRVQELFRDEYIVPKLNFNEIILSLNDDEGGCNAVAGGFHDVALQSIEERGYVGDQPYTVGENVFSKDPLALTTLQSDPLWSDFVRWIFWALVYAEENGINQATASDMPSTKLFGPLRTNALYHAVNAVGNYGEIYDRNFQELVPRGGLHELNVDFGPMMRALPGIALKQQS